MLFPTEVMVLWSRGWVPSGKEESGWQGKSTMELPVVRSTSSGSRADLRALRDLKGISLDHIAESSKIRLYYLQAIEEGMFEKLPGGIFTISYLRQYARAIGLPEADLLELYHSCRTDA